MFSILVVEDDKGILANLNFLLRSEGYNVLIAHNGLEALKIIDSELPDLILSDVMMPYLDGIELFKRVKEEYKLLQTPFIFLTAKSDPTSMRQGLGLGADDYITKPFENDDILQAVKVRLQKKEFYNAQLENMKQNLNKYVPHELRTPLVSILGFSDLIINDIDDLDKDMIKEMTEKIFFSGKRLLNRVEKFVSVYEVESLAIDVKDEIFSSSSIIDDAYVLSLIEEHFLLNPIKDNITLKLDEANIKIHSRYLYLLIRELLENASKFSSFNSQITVSGHVKGKMYELIVADNGIGFSKSEISNITQFQQFERDTYNQEGNGLGLALVIKILDIFHGKLNITSKKNAHTFVKCTIPLN